VDFDETSLPDVSAFSQIGPPRNVTVDARTDGFLVSWESPDYGSDMLSLYVVRWYLEPEHKLQGKAETRSNFYTGKSDDVTQSDLCAYIFLSFKFPKSH
jgi:hypothetical protein